MSKAKFVRSLQVENKPLSPYDISQRIRLEYGFVSIYKGDPEMSVDHFRGYMVKAGEKLDPTPEDPELYTCVISLEQNKAWQDIVWIKEILQVLDSKKYRTDTPEKLGQMLDNRRTNTVNGTDTPPHVAADKLGLTLALGSAIPHSYREILRAEKYLEKFTKEELEDLLIVPKELIEDVLRPQFEVRFEQALLDNS